MKIYKTRKRYKEGACTWYGWNTAPPGKWMLLMGDSLGRERGTHLSSLSPQKVSMSGTTGTNTVSSCPRWVLKKCPWPWAVLLILILNPFILAESSQSVHEQYHWYWFCSSWLARVCWTSKDIVKSLFGLAEIWLIAYLTLAAKVPSHATFPRAL